MVFPKFINRSLTAAAPFPSGTRRQAAVAAMCIMLAGCAALNAATVTGRIELSGSRDQAVRKHKDYSGVVVWLEPEGALVNIALPAGRARMVQKGKRFLPHVLAVTTGSTVDFPNFDPIFHNAFSNFSGQPFDVGLYPPGTSKSVTFLRPGIVRVFCNIHPTMSAIIAVVNTPYHAVSAASGALQIPDVRPGTYRLHVFHERARQEVLKRFERTIDVPAAGADIGELAISEEGYIPAPHKNKYGRDYPPVVEDQPAYSGGRK